MKHIFVLGGAGFVGSNFIYHVLKNKKNKFKIINIDKLSYASNIKFLSEIKQNYFFYKSSIGNQKKLTSLLKKYKPFRIINFAANTHVDKSIENSKGFVKDNIVELNNLLSTLKNYLKTSKTKLKFHQVSTDEVFGDVNFKSKKKFLENQFYNPSNPYAASKAAADHLVTAWSKTFKIPVSITHCSNNFGENQFIEKLIPKIIMSFLKNRKIDIYGKGKNIRNWIYVKDHCYILKKILISNVTGRFNISSTNNFNNLEIAKKIFNYLKKIDDKKFSKFNLFYKFVKDRPGHDKKYSINSNKLRKKFKWSERYTFDEAIQKTICWYLKNNFIYNKKTNSLKRMGNIK